MKVVGAYVTKEVVVPEHTINVFDEDAYWRLDWQGEPDDEGGFFYNKAGFPTVRDASTSWRPMFAPPNGKDRRGRIAGAAPKETDVIHRSQMTAILMNLGLEVNGDPYKHGQPFDVVAARKLVLAYDESNSPDYMTSGGTVLPKTKKRREIDRALFVSQCNLLADHPNQPFGMTDMAVEITVRDAVNRTRKTSNA